MKMLLQSCAVGRANPWDEVNQDDDSQAGERRAGNVMDFPWEGSNSRQSGDIKKIVVATDFSPGSTAAMEQAVTLARQCAATLTILHVVDINPAAAYTYAGSAESLRQSLQVEAVTRMAQLAGSLAQAQVEVQALVVEGLPGEEIVEHCDSYDLVVLGTGPAKRTWNLFSKHTAQKVIDAAACPVLVVRERQRGRAEAARSQIELPRIAA
jgi:nucleotide-binding universal stress UspA family protein